MSSMTQVGDYFQTFVLTIAGLVRDAIIAGASITKDEFESYSTALRTQLGHAGHPDPCQPLIWQAWGRVPEVAAG